jgi:hypothetical protein
VWQGKTADPEKGITVDEGGLLAREKREWKSGEIISAGRHISSESDEAPERFVMWKISVAVNLSMTTIGPPQLGQSRRLFTSVGVAGSGLIG